MKKSQEFELRKRCGDPNVLCGIKEYVFSDGPARGVRAFDLKNGRGLELTVAADRGLDIPYCSFKGVNVGLLNKVGLRSPWLYQEDAARGFLRQFYGGLMTTGGLSYAGAACEEDGRVFGLHGKYDNTPADSVRAWRDAEGDDVVLRVAGEIRESEVFGPHLLLKRTLTLETESNRLRIHDEVENQGFLTSPLMLVYHINFGYPLLDDGARIYTNASRVEPRSDFAREGLSSYDRMEAPEVGREEQCYFHTGQPGSDAFAMLHNERLGMAAIVRYDAALLPQLCEWKCMRAGEYAIGLEPTTSGVLSRTDARRDGILGQIEPGEIRTYDVNIEFTDDCCAIEALKARACRP